MKQTFDTYYCNQNGVVDQNEDGSVRIDKPFTFDKNQCLTFVNYSYLIERFTFGWSIVLEHIDGEYRKIILRSDREKYINETAKKSQTIEEFINLIYSEDGYQ